MITTIHFRIPKQGTVLFLFDDFRLFTDLEIKPVCLFLVRVCLSAVVTVSCHNFGDNFCPTGIIAHCPIFSPPPRGSNQNECKCVPP